MERIWLRIRKSLGLVELETGISDARTYLIELSHEVEIVRAMIADLREALDMNPMAKVREMDEYRPASGDPQIGGL